MSQAAESTPLPPRQDTGEYILLKRRHVNWYAPALYKMTGGSFDEMLNALRALPKEQRRFEDDWHTGRRWVVNPQAIETLRSQGFTIEKEPDIQFLYKIEEIKSNVHTSQSGAHWYEYGILATLRVRNQHGQMQTVEEIPIILHHGEDTWEWKRKVEETVAACNVLSERIKSAWEEAKGNDRSLEAWVKAADAIKQYLGRVFIWCGHEPPPADSTVYEDKGQAAPISLLLLPAPKEEESHASGA